MGPGDRVMPGQRSDSIPAAAFNGWQDAAEWVRRQRTFGQPPLSPNGIPPGALQVKNASGENLRRFSVVIPDNPVFEPADDDEPDAAVIAAKLLAFQDQPCLRVFPAGPGDDLTTFLILQEPLPAGAIGRALAYGVTAAKLDIQAETDKYAVAQSGDRTTLTTTPYGGVPIVWKPAGTGIKWGYVSLAPFQRETFLATLTDRESNFYSWQEVGSDTTGDLNAFEAIYGSQSVVLGSVVRMRPEASGQFSFDYDWSGQLGKAKSGGVPGRSGSTAGSATVQITADNLTVIDELTAYNHSTAPVAADAPLMLKYIRGALWVDWEQC